VEFGEALVAEVITDVSEEEATSEAGIEECLIVCGQELEVAVNVAGFTEAQVEDLLLQVVGGSSEHPGFERQPDHAGSPSPILDRAHDSGIVDTISIEVVLRVTPRWPPLQAPATDSTAAGLRSG
jgi:hypothetical protein